MTERSAEPGAGPSLISVGADTARKRRGSTQVGTSSGGLARGLWKADPRPAPSADVAYVQILSLDEALHRYAADWAELRGSRPQATFFQSPGWCACVGLWHEEAAADSSSREDAPFVMIAHARDDRVTAVWPLQGERHLGCLFAVAMGEPFTQYADILVACDADEDAIIYAFLEALRSLGRFSGVVLRKVRQDAICRPYIAEDAMVFGQGAAPAVDFRPFANFDAYHRTIKSKTRKNLRNARNRLMREGAAVASEARTVDGGVDHKVHRDPAAVAEVAQRAFRLRADYLALRG
ncbi:MAG: hypothetical protein AAFZ01_14620, partial [Pseudomonadota bacterium]